MQQTLVGRAFCDAPPGTETGEALTWGQDERVTRAISVDCTIQMELDLARATITPATAVDSLSTRSQRRRRFTPASSGTFGPAQLTRFRVELGQLEGPLQLCEWCSPGGLATYWTRDLEEHLVAMPAE